MTAGRTPDPGVARVSTPSLLALAVTAFVVELALFGGVGAVAYDAAGAGLRGWVSAAVATAAVLVLWGLLIAPKAPYRLPTGARLVATAALCVGTAYGLVQAGFTTWGWFVGVAGLAVVTAQLVIPTAHQSGPPASGA